MSMSGGDNPGGNRRPAPLPPGNTGAQVYGGAMRDAALQGAPIDISSIVGTVRRGLPAGAPGTNTAPAQPAAPDFSRQLGNLASATPTAQGMNGQYGGLLGGMLSLPGGGFGYGDPNQLARAAALQSLYGGLFPGGAGYGLLGGFGGYGGGGYNPYGGFGGGGYSPYGGGFGGFGQMPINYGGGSYY